jgi:hypothetical protein
MNNEYLSDRVLVSLFGHHPQILSLENIRTALTTSLNYFLNPNIDEMLKELIHDSVHDLCNDLIIR